MRFRIDFANLFGKGLDRLFALALTHPDTFHGAARPILQGHAEGDFAAGQELALEGLRSHLHVLRQHADRFLLGSGNVIVENEAYTRFGPGIAIALLNKLALRLHYLEQQGVPEASRLFTYQRSRWRAKPSDEET